MPSCRISAIPRRCILKYAEQLRDSLPDSVKAAAREPLDAVALIYAMLLVRTITTRATQLAEIAKRVDPAIPQKTAALFPDVSQAAAHAHLPMVNLALGTLRHLTADQFTQFSQTLQWLIESDGKIELFEFVLQKIVLHHLAPQFGQAPRADGAILHPQTARAGLRRPAFRAGKCRQQRRRRNSKGVWSRRAVSARAGRGALGLLPREQCGVDQIDAALNRLAQAVADHQEEPAGSLHPHRRRGRRDSGRRSRTAPRRRRHAGLPDAAVCGGRNNA